MTLLIIIFGALTLFAGIIIVLNPETIFGFLRNTLATLEIHILAVLIRLILGVLLTSQASISEFPFAIEIIGWLSIVAAVCLGVMGRRNFKRLMSWALPLVNFIGRFSGVFAMMFGTFLIYAFV